ncbi:hypothetical protein JOD82_001814 [Paenibacillus sp. 1182]|uniref:hypothetical protein n=1 Tax=Paenibacillus sp. 1182 TaxID=2806565 RepID=UPI001AE55B0E|nr:hypothetical protein [Paenibacillus sp. 1182]MBP1308794.1 hypothetical protein [Paenibacillus sp. 1182]
MSIQALLNQYKELIDFTDKTQKSNFKWVSSFLTYQNKKHPNEDNESFMLDAIDVHKRYLLTRK